MCYRRHAGDDKQNERQTMKTKSLFDLTSNQYFGGLNRRFDKRCRLLVRLGYRCFRGGWFRPCRYKIGFDVIWNSSVLNADKRCWLELYLKSPEHCRLLPNGSNMLPERGKK